MCVVATLFILYFTFVKTKGDPIDHSDHLNSAYAPSVVKFNDIFTNSISMLAEEPSAAAVKDEDVLINNIPTQFVEFPSQTPESTTIMTPPPPKYILKSSYLNNSDTETTSVQSTASSTHESSTEKHEETVQVIPIKKNTQRGVLDLLFPASRVRTFKGIFDTFRRILSHTFR